MSAEEVEHVVNVEEEQPSSSQAPAAAAPTDAVAESSTEQEVSTTTPVGEAAQNHQASSSVTPPSPSKAEEMQPKKVAVVSASSAPPPPPRQMSREEFLRQMGLAPDDLLESPPRATTSGSNATSPYRAAPADPAASQPPQLAGDAPEVIQDDQWVRNTVFTDVTLIQAGATERIANDAKKAIIDSYRATRSHGGASASIDGASGDVVVSSPQREQRAQEMVTNEDHAMASDYKASLLEEFRKRKKMGEAKQPPPTPQRGIAAAS
jgi:hypothetical protein